MGISARCVNHQAEVRALIIPEKATKVVGGKEGRKVDIKRRRDSNKIPE
jgi:hypothetical protein